MAAAVPRRCLLISVALIVVAFALGIIIGVFAIERPSSSFDLKLKTLIRAADPSVSQKLINGIIPNNIDRHLKILTEKPHIAGRAGNKKTADYVRDEWVEQGYDVETVPYDVLLSYPEDNHNNTVSLHASDGRLLFRSTAQEHIYSNDQNHKEAVQPFNAFSPSGNPESELVFANYGRDEDFKYLEDEGINCSGKIVIAKFGKIFRGNKVLNAQNAGAVGIILYLDPGDFTKGKQPYPSSWWLPGTGAQRGNVVVLKGDQATPGYPATWYSYRLSGQKIKERLPQIPCQPIGYDDAFMLLREVHGREAPAEWQGGLNITYRTGGVMRGNRKVKLDVRNNLQTVTIYNVIATVKGTIEPDKVVLVGNHRDAWVYGGVDPSSGTATLLEMSRMFGVAIKDGWQPRRTLMFCSWDAEEYGLVGSFEWVEENAKWLRQQAVAYLNIDSATSGNYTFDADATPSLKETIMRAANKIQDPHQEGRRLIEVWSERKSDPSNPGKPKVDTPGAGTDFVPFEQFVGIPTLTTKYKYIDLGDTVYKSTYPLYHTLYDGYRLVKMIDPEFRCSAAIASLNAEVARDLVDSPILPMDIRDYAKAVENFVKILKTERSAEFASRGLSLDGVLSASRNFTASAALFHQNLDKIDLYNPMEVRRMNDKLQSVEKAFLDQPGLPGRPHFKHVLLSPSRANYYKATSFPGLSDLLFKIGNDASRWEQVKQHVSVLAYCIQSAAKILMS